MGVQVEKMVARLTDRVEELAVRPEDGTATLSSHVLVSICQISCLSHLCLVYVPCKVLLHSGNALIKGPCICVAVTVRGRMP